MRTAYLRRLYLRNRSLVRTVGVVIGLGLVSPVFGQTTITRSFIIDVHKKEILEIGRPDTGHVVARDINDAGQVVGTSQTHGAFITGPNGTGMTSLGPGPYGRADNPVGINAAGQVALTAYGRWQEGDDVSLYPHAFITGPNGVGMTDLGAVWQSSSPTAINDAGLVVGQTGTPDFFGAAFIASVQGMSSLGTLGGRGNTHAYAINNAGQVVGGSITYEGEGRAFITGGPTGMTDLGTLGGRFRSDSTAYGINAAGRVVGVSDTAEEGERHAFITGPDGTGMTDLGTLGGRSSIASDINDSGEVIGMSETADGATRVFITGPGGEGMMDLTSLVRLPAGLVLTDAAAINNLGQVLVVSTIPEPETYAMLLAGLSLIGFMARRKKMDTGALG